MNKVATAEEALRRIIDGSTLASRWVVSDSAGSRPR
jgi:hypothetical protein